MTINLPKDVENGILAAVHRGQFASAEELISEAVRSFLRQPTAPPADPGLGSIGAMADAAEELDEIVEEALRNRREQPWRLNPGE